MTTALTPTQPTALTQADLSSALADFMRLNVADGDASQHTAVNSHNFGYV